MKKIQIIFIVYFLSIVGLAQNGKITYSLLLNKSKYAGYEDDLKKELDIITKNENSISANLYFNSKEMKFEIDKSTDLSITDYENILRIADNEGVFYKSNSNNSIFRLISGKQIYRDVICTRKFITNWEYFNEKKTVAGYDCFKAQCVLGTDYGDGEIIYSYPITAWYCPEIKNAIGPKGIGGLPGVILELHQNLVVFIAAKIELNASQKDLSLPKLKIIKEMDLIKYIQSSINN